MKKKKLLLASIFASCSFGLWAGSGLVSISTEYPGGNVKTNKVEAGVVEFEADLRDTKLPWFYWNFEAKAEEAGKVEFKMPLKRLMMSAQGPAVSLDNGKTWNWIGKENVKFYTQDNNNRDSFTWDFANKGDVVRFSQTIPYQKSNLDEFVNFAKNNELFSQKVLTKSKKGNDVPLFVIGKEDAKKKNVLFTARHHAAESVASYVLEGLMRELLSDSSSAKDFLSKYVVYVVPFVDYDGVENGDQGKNRKPHDHNRDYRQDTMIYPETQAIVNLNTDKKFHIAIDIHDPSVRRDIHEVYSFWGARTKQNNIHILELQSWLLNEAPAVIGNTLILMKPDSKTLATEKGTPCATYFSYLPENAFAFTLEAAFAKSSITYNEKIAAKYGKALIRSLARMNIEKNPKPHTEYANFMKFSKTINGAPAKYTQVVNDTLNDPNASPLYKEEAKSKITILHNRIREFDKTIAVADEVLASNEATTKQKLLAAAQKTIAMNNIATTTDEDMEKWFNEVQKYNPAGQALYDICEIMYLRAIKNKKNDDAFKYASIQVDNAPIWLKGKARNRVAEYYKETKDPKFEKYNEETIAFLHKQVFPKMNIGVWGPVHTLELAKAMMRSPNPDKKEIIKVLNLGINHKFSNIFGTKNKLNKLLAELNK